jgi:hypothetical protein
MLTSGPKTFQHGVAKFVIVKINFGYIKLS